MRKLSLVIALVLGGSLLGCTSAEDKQAKQEEKVYSAEADQNEKKQELYRKYNDCINSARGDANKLSECDVYLDEMKALQ